MRGFIILLSIFALGSAEEHNTGYYYQQPVQSFIPYVSSLHLATDGSVGSAYSNIEHSMQQYTHQSQSQLPATYNKEFYSFLAPEDVFEDPNALNKIQTAVQRNVRVIFIRTPENRALEHAAIELAKLGTEDKTAIYVLNKQANLGDLADRLNTLRVHSNSKPEVHFVKYRTAEEAAHAQQSIQAHYDSQLPGQTQNFNEGIAPALNFISKSIGYAGQSTDLLHKYPSNSYLPAQLATSSSYGNLLGQTTDINSNFGIPQLTGNLQVGASISTAPNINSGYAGYLGQGVDLNFGATSTAFELDGLKENQGVPSYEPRALNFKDNAIARINSRTSTGGSSSFVFPTDAPATNTYLPPLPPLPPLSNQRKF